MKNLVIAFVLSLAVLSSIGQSSTEAHLINKQTLEELLLRVDPWPSDTGRYSRDNWNRLVKAAEIVQQSDCVSVETALTDFQNDQMGINDVDAKLFLMMRVVFELPERSPKQQRFSFGGWITRRPGSISDLNVDGTFNLSWPVSWVSGQPQLISGFQGARGRPYDAAQEYHYLRGKFKMRDFTAIKDQSEIVDAQLVSLETRHIFMKGERAMVSLAQWERTAKDALLSCEPAVEWASLKKVTASIDPANQHSFLTITFSFAAPREACRVTFQGDGSVAAIARETSADSIRSGRSQKEKPLRVYQGVVPTKP